MYKQLLILCCFLMCSMAGLATNNTQQTATDEPYAVINNFGEGSDCFEVTLYNKPEGTNFTWHCEEGWEVLSQTDDYAMFFYTGTGEAYRPTWLWLEYYDTDGQLQRIIWEFDTLVQ